MIGKLTERAFLKVIRMSVKWLYLIMLILMIGCQQAGIIVDNPAAQTDEKTAETEIGRQLRINKETLLQGPNEQIRVDAATVMLFSEATLARKTLLEVLRQPENTAAQSAVCKALGQARAARETVENKQDFIQPLLKILTSKTSSTAKLAAEATLIFEYEQISEPLEKLIADASLPANARLNAIYALKLQPDMRAIFKLIDLLDDADEEVSAASENALHSLGIPVGKDAETRKQIIDELKRKGKNEFLRDWLIRQEVQMRNLEAELNLWQGLYLSALGRIYDGISDDTTKGTFLAEHLSSSEAIVRLWALEKVAQWRMGTKSKLPAELGPILVNLVSDPDRSVKLQTAKLLSLMGQLNSAEKLLEQLQVEQDNEVKIELFVALGWACYYASLPDSKIKISPEIRKRTLELASEYLSEQDAKKAQEGAEVVKKLLEQDGLTSADVGKYLARLAERYNQEKNKPSETLRGELLSDMAELCVQSVYKAEAKKLFKPLFEQGLSDEVDLVRQAAVDGLIHIDRTRALETFRKVLINDNNIKVREKIINLAGEVGGKDDLVWLAEKIGSTTEAEPAWQAMLRIFRQSDAAVLAEWLQNFTSQSNETGLSDEQMISFLKIAEQKAVGENKPEVLRSASGKLAQLYTKTGDFKQAAELWGRMYETAPAEEKEIILPSLMDAYLRGGNLEAAALLVDNRLLLKDLDSNDVVVRSIDNCLKDPPAGADPNVILEALATIATIELSEPRPKWQQQLKRWTDRFARSTGSKEPK